MARCGCGASASALVAVEGLLCDDRGTTRTYMFCDDCGRNVLRHYRSSEYVGEVSGAS